MSLHLIHASHPALASAQADTVVPSLFLFLFLLVFSLLFFFFAFALHYSLLDPSSSQSCKHWAKCSPNTAMIKRTKEEEEERGVQNRGREGGR
mmetsp:Transcript_3947/g.7509  ORF Transcript_3947/g.7509 Transcript_3947/m.7509 type:complete len:93 (-) Transcript_3947:1627-1905(-)